jgi:ubiquinone biosynthesis protein
MTILETVLVAARDRKRLAEIVSVLTRYGLDDLLIRLGLSGLLPSGRHAADSQTRPGPERLRLALEALGPTFVKLGQILSTRADLLGPEWTSELEKLQSHVAPSAWETIRAQVEEDLGGPPEDVFARFDTVPIAAGSVAQVHRAQLASGEEVVVKVRRAGLRPLIEADVRLLSHAAHLVEREWPAAARYRPREILEQLGAAMTDELDLARESRNSQAVAANLADMPDVRIPRLYPQWTCERLLVQEFIDGLPPANRQALVDAGLDCPLLARRGATAFLHMALIDGFFHADPHPGNLRALPGNAIAFIDFGQVGHLSQRRRQQLLALIGAIVKNDAESLGFVMLEWSGTAGIDLPRLEGDCSRFLARHGKDNLRLGDTLMEFMALARRNQLAMPAELALLFKALMTADGVMRNLDPDFDAVRVAAPLVRREMRERLRPQALLDRGRGAALNLLGLAGEAPSLMRLLALRLREGRLAADIDVKGLDRIGGDIRWAASRIAVALVVAAFALGLAPRLLDFGPAIFGFPLTAILGLLVILGGFIWLLRPRRG